MIEDMLFGTIIISQAKQIMLYNQTLYYRRVRNDSISSITNKQQAIPFFINDISKKLSLEESRLYFYCYSNVCLCVGLYDYFFEQNKNKMDRKILECIDLIISQRISISLNALHFEDDPRNARKKLKN